MAKTIRVSDDYHAYIAAQNQDDETMEETLRRLAGGPHPEYVAGLIDNEEAGAILEAIDAADRRTGRFAAAEETASDS